MPVPNEQIYRLAVAVLQGNHSGARGMLQGDNNFVNPVLAAFFNRQRFSCGTTLSLTFFGSGAERNKRVCFQYRSSHHPNDTPIFEVAWGDEHSVEAREFCKIRRVIVRAEGCFEYVASSLAEQIESCAHFFCGDAESGKEMVVELEHDIKIAFTIRDGKWLFVGHTNRVDGYMSSEQPDKPLIPPPIVCLE